MVTTSNSCTLVGIDAEIVEVECTLNLAPADLRKPGSRLDLPILARSIDRLIQIARTIADRLDLDDLDAGRLREATAHRDAAPTADLVSHVR
jgi:hypothetical protein